MNDPNTGLAAPPDLLAGLGEGRPPNNSSRRPARTTRYIDYFANTSLDESGPDLGPRPPPPPRRRPTVPRRGRDPNVEFEERQARREAAREEMTAEHENEKAERREVRLDKHRAKEPDFTKVFKAQLQQWQTDSPAAFALFDEHMRHCIAASTHTVRAVDMMLWYPDIPRHIKLPLQDLAKHYHGEASLIYIIRQAEDKTLSWVRLEETHPEISHAAHQTKVIVQGPHDITDQQWSEVTWYNTFGFGKVKDEAAVGDFPDYNDSWNYGYLTGRQLLLTIKSNLEARKALLMNPAANRFTGANFEATMDCHVMNWQSSALKYLKSKLPDFKSPEVSTDDKLLMKKVHNEILAYASTPNWTEYREIRHKLKVYMEEYESLARADDESMDEEEQDTQDMLADLEGDFDAFEETHGRDTGILGSKWRPMAISR